jgi:subfamily B ATP-binding cassette protein MsbA
MPCRRVQYSRGAGILLAMLVTRNRSADIYVRLLGHVRPYWRVFVLAVGGMLALAATEWMLPALLKQLIDEEFERAALDISLTLPLVLIALFFVRGVLSYVSTVSLAWISHRTVMDLRAAMYHKLINLPSIFFDHRSSGELISKFTFDVTQVSQATTRVLTVMVKDTAVIVALLSYLFYLNWRLATLLLVLAPPVAFVVYRVSQRMREKSRQLQQAIGELNQIAEEGIRGQREIKVYAGQAFEIGRFGRAINDARRFQMKVVQTSAATVPIIQVLIACGIAAMIILALGESASGTMSRGDFVAFVTATALLLPPTKRLTGVNEFLQRGLAAAESVFGLIDEPHEASPGTKRLADVEGTIEFRGLDASYADNPVLRNINLTIAAGEAVALVGPSGGGKSTMLDLVARFYHFDAGELTIDGHRIEEISLESLREAIAYVGQDVILFDDTIYNNIAYGALRSASRDQVIAAAEAACVVPFAAQMPQGMETVIGPNGARLSGGQRQRIAIARALLKDAPILILDEATSSLDTQSERQIQTALARIRKGRTSLLIAHRLSTIETADRIVVLEDGQIVESGTHAELLKLDGVYAKLAAMQGAIAVEH